jgi:hypothetical protein
LHETAEEQMNITHYARVFYPPPRKIIQCNPWADWMPSPSPSKTENLTLKGEVGIEHWTCPWITGVGQGAKLSASNSQWSNMGEASKSWKREPCDKSTSQRS